MMIRGVVTGFLIVMMPLLCWADHNPTPNFVPTSDLKPITVEGGVITWDANADSMVASDNVKIQYGGYSASSGYISINTKDKTVFIPTEFLISSNRMTLQAQNGLFNFGTYTGFADAVHAHVAGIFIVGDSIEFGPEIIRIKNAKFTTCDQVPPHYLVEASDISIFPALGFIVADNNVLTINDVPVFYFPTYIYGNKSYSLLGQNSPIPEIGSDATQGWYIKENWAFVIDKQSSGVAHFGYVELNGFYMGLSHHLDINPNNNIETRVNYLQFHGWGGGIAYHLETANNDHSDPLLVENLLSSLFPNQNLPLSRLSILFSYHELVNNYWIDYFPLFKAEINQFKIMFLGVSPVLTSDVNFGQIRERDAHLKNEVQSWQTNYNADLAQTFPIVDRVEGTVGVRFIGYWFDTSQSWQRYFTMYKIAMDWGSVKPYVGYLDNVSNMGFSQFKYQTENVIQHDEVMLGADTLLGALGLNGDFHYDLELGRVRDASVAISILNHCNRFGVRWNLVSRSVALIVDVLPLP